MESGCGAVVRLHRQRSTASGSRAAFLPSAGVCCNFSNDWRRHRSPDCILLLRIFPFSAALVVRRRPRILPKLARFSTIRLLQLVDVNSKTITQCPAQLGFADTKKIVSRNWPSEIDNQILWIARLNTIYLVQSHGPSGGRSYLCHRRCATQGPDCRDSTCRRVVAWPSGTRRCHRRARHVQPGHRLTAFGKA